jgi:hypothetical protein
MPALPVLHCVTEYSACSISSVSIQ